jgi:hypothetical protein
MLHLHNPRLARFIFAVAENHQPLRAASPVFPVPIESESASSDADSP